MPQIAETVAAGLLESEITIDSLPGEVWRVSESLAFHDSFEDLMTPKKSPFSWTEFCQDAGAIGNGSASFQLWDQILAHSCWQSCSPQENDAK